MKKNIFYLFAILLLLSGCYPGGTEYYEETDIVYTNYEEGYMFQGKTSYSMPDKIVKITGNVAEGEDPEFVKEPFNTEILNMIADNMAEMGYVREDDPANADMLLTPLVWSNTTVYYWYDYWCWYYPYYCGWGWGYPSVSTYTTGTFVMGLIANDADVIEPTSVWTAAANGLMSGSYDVTRVTNAIDQAFEQSPYLSTK